MIPKLGIGLISTKSGNKFTELIFLCFQVFIFLKFFRLSQIRLPVMIFF